MENQIIFGVGIGVVSNVVSDIITRYIDKDLIMRFIYKEKNIFNSCVEINNYEPCTLEEIINKLENIY